MSEVRASSTSPRRVVIACVVLLVALALTFGWIVSRVAVTAIELTRLEGSARTLIDAAASGDAGAVTSGVHDLVAHADAAGGAASDPLWAVAEALPWVGDDVAAIRTVAVHAAAVGQALLPVVDAAAGGTDFTSDLPGIHQHLATAAGVLADAESALADVQARDLEPRIADAVQQVHAQLAAATPTVRTLAGATAALPELWGLDGARSVLVMMQNSAEARTGGGITGSFALLSADAGGLTLVTQADSSSFDGVPMPSVETAASSKALYGDIIGRYVQNASLTTDFDLTARLASAWWVTLGHPAPDAIVSVDPLVMRALLSVTGPVTLADGSTLSADTLVERLLIEPYMTLDSAGQTAFLQSVTSAVVAALATVQADPLTWARALAAPLAGGSVSIWTADARVRDALAGTPLAGPAARHAAAGPGGFAVYVNDATGGKLDTFLHLAIASQVSQCREDGRAETQISVTMSSSLAADAVLPGSMSGDGRYGTGIGDIGTSISVAAPPGTFFGGVQKDGVPEVSVDVDDNGFPTSLVRVNLSPGEVNVIDFRFVATGQDALLPQILTTPLLNPAEISDPVLAPCA